MSYMELFDKDVMEEEFSSTELLHVLSDKTSFPIDKERRVFRKKEYITIENEVHDYIYFIQSGICGVWKNEHINNFIGENDIIGFNEILGNEPSFTSVIALNDIITWRFSKEQVMSKLMYSQEGAFYLYQYMKLVNANLLQKQTLQTEETKKQLILTLIHLGQQYGEENQHQIILPKIFTKKIVANYLGMTRQHMTHICKDFECNEVFEADANQFILNKANISISH
ncbi:Crp/Fnr family transcriptional regulator [Listeria booriae]|uniref:Crp/Fnr family transcriptional regulator n=1 Tax=Listeria booriae TaxID=1552123 RepID=A0A841Y3F2_9LIST|nr:Crp/Fnr family transcriptional regulator [Listeria booriae]MBC1371973.1 Crp/Fnr family transcriptional regulator [Listeria booriae]